MALTLHYHPLSSFCWKALIALYENAAPFTPRLLNLGDPAEHEAYEKLWPLTKMPVLEDDGRMLPETTVIIEYLDRRHPGPAPLIPADPDLALETRLMDRLFDLYVHLNMQKIVLDNIRPEGGRDPVGVIQAREQARAAYRVLNDRLAGREWANGSGFSLADCAAAPALNYINRVEPIGESHPHLRAYLARLEARPSFARVLEEAQPYMHFFPG